VNSLFSLLGIESWKPILAALLLPPVPLLVLVLIGARLILPRRGLGWLLILVSVALLWLSACTGAAQLFERFVLRPPAALSPERIQQLKTEAAGKPTTAIVVLGGGLQRYAPEYDVSNLKSVAVARLRYGLWLGRQTGLPVAYSGGVGWAQIDAEPEALTAQRIATREFGRPLAWAETRSRDTRENAARSLALLRPTGVRHIVLVTDGWHMPRALRAFREAAGDDVRIEPAPMGLARNAEQPALRWLPSIEGFAAMRHMLHEMLGRLAGA
jgi:uncharacterized SAM-binding protein YcdF (DUF218 family)